MNKISVVAQTLLIEPLSMVLLRVALFSLSVVVGKVAKPMLRL